MKRNCKKNVSVKNMVFISALLIVTGMFTACGKPDKADIEKDLSENVPFDAATGGDAVYEEIPESLSYTVESGDIGSVKVKAEVYAEGYGQVPTYKLKKREKNDAWVKSYAEKLFDDGEYINVKPYDFCSREELETEKQFWEERLLVLDESSNGYERVESEISYLEYAIEQFSESDYVKYPEEQLVFEESYYNDAEDDKSYHENAQLRGEVDGDVWLLNYSYTMYGGEYRESVPMESHVPVLYGSCLEKMDYLTGSYGMEMGIYDNKCDQAQAENEAEKFLDRLGFHNMKCVKMTELLPYVMNFTDQGGGAVNYFDGYCIIYGPSPDGVNMFSGVDNGVCEDGEHIAVQPYVCIVVNSKGVSSFCIMEDYEFEEKLSENSSMLSFSQIDDIARTEFEKILEEYPKTQYEITKVKFEYLCVTYDGISYAMVPVWTYYSEFIIYGDTDLHPVLIVNALDGAVITNTYVYADWEYYFIMQ